jgi:hypothetical protein
MVAAELEHARPAAVEGIEVVLEVADVRRPIVEKRRAEVEAAIAAVAGAVARVVLRPPGAPAAESVRPEGSPKRLDQQSERDQRLAAYRSKDQALDAVAEALDLELLD